jgi:hypothetical protein
LLLNLTGTGRFQSLNPRAQGPFQITIPDSAHK